MVVVVALMAGRLDAAQDDAVARARVLAADGQRGEAVVLLRATLVAEPENNDARVLLGTVLSWDGRYEEARRELQPVLEEDPAHSDALAALVHVELWSDHPREAEALASRALRNRPTDTAMLLARARALIALLRPGEAEELLDRLLAIDPRNDAAREVRRDTRASMRLWRVRVGFSYDGFSDGRAGWRDTQVSIERAAAIGAVSVKATSAQRFGRHDGQIEVEAYPRLRAGTYAYVAAAYSRDAILFPGYRYAVDLSQSIGNGFEASIGFRRLGFGSGVNIYVGSLTKYYGNWLFNGRTFIAPGLTTTTRSYHASARRYVGDDGTYAGVRYGRGKSREVRTLNDFEVLDSDVVGAEAIFVVRRRVEVNVSGSYGREDRAGRAGLGQYSVATGLGFRF